VPSVVFTRIFSPSVMNAGTCTTNPVSSLAGLVTLETVAPLKPGSVSNTVRSTVAGSSTPIALPS
jgi:glutamate-1-semialdehyde aminotransferase